MLVIADEDADHFEELRSALMLEHDPQSVLECELVERLAGILWRLRRVPFFEAAILDARQAQVAEEMREEEERRRIGVAREEQEKAMKTKRNPTRALCARTLPYRWWA